MTQSDIKKIDNFKISEEFFRSAIEVIPFGVFILSDRKIVYVNAAVEKIFGWKLDELIGQSIEVLYRNKREFEEIGARIYSKFGKVASFSEMYPAKHKSGKDILCNITICRLTDQLEKKEIVAIYEDITERVNAEKELQESEDKYRSYIENTHDIVFNLTPDGKVLSGNKVWHQTFGYDEASIGSLEPSQILQAEYVSAFLEIIKKTGANEPVLNKEIHFAAKDGRQIIIVGNFIPRTFYGQVVSIGCFCRDLTENRRIEQDIKEKIKELERFNQLTVGREMKMMELKDKIKKLEAELGR